MKKRIAFVVESFAIGGAERILIDIFNHLNRDKYDVTILSIFKHSVYNGTSQYKDLCKFKYIINNHFIFIRNLTYFIIHRFPRLFCNLFLDNSYDTIIAFYEGLPTLLISHAKKHHKKIAWLHTSTDLSIPNKEKSNLQKYESIYKQYDKIIAVSKGVENSFTSLFPQLHPKVITIYNSIDVDRIKTKSLEKNKKIAPKTKAKIFVAIGRIIPLKGYERLIEAFSTLIKSGYDINLWIVGGGGHEHLQKMALELQIKDKITFWGYQTNPYPFIVNADFVILSSYLEGLNTVLIESMILGKCVISTKCNGSDEILGNSEYGLIVENSKVGIINGIKKVLNEPYLKDYYEEKSIKRADFFNISINIENLKKYL